MMVHEKSTFHKKCAELILHRENSVPVNAKLEDALLKEQRNARVCLLTIFSSVRFLVRTGNAVRGHQDDGGNLRILLEERMVDVPQLEPWLRRREKYLSGDIQNEIMQMMAHKILRGIVTDIQASPWFAIIADGTTDCVGREQFSICVRFVHPSTLNIRECFVGLYNPDDCRGSTLADVIKDVLLRMNLPIRNLRGHCFDGAANMSGREKGVQRILSDEQPKSLYVHCANHAADLALQEVARSRGGICELLCLVKDSSNFILESAKRRKVYEGIVLSPCTRSAGNDNPPSSESMERASSLIALCPTRWCVRVRSLVRYKTEYRRVQETLRAIIDESGAASDERKVAARGWLRKLTKFETLFFLNVSIEVFSPCEELARALQKPSGTAAGAKRAAQMLIQQIARLRAEQQFEIIYERACTEADELELEHLPEPRKRKPPQRFEQTAGMSTPPAHLQEKDLLRKEYYEVLDLMRCELKERFQQKGLDRLADLEELILGAIRKEVPPEDVLREKLGQFSDDFNIGSLQAQLKILSNLRDHVISSCVDLAKQLSKESDTVRDLLHEVILLLVLIMTVPASVASAERSFSALRRLKTCLRSTMTQKRLTHAMILHVHQEATSKLDLYELMKEFVSKSKERKQAFGNV